tara:strand:+ start:3784 stop:4212 length:429 start_codon:yes stop_codon:yes gene_type:complete
MSSKLCAFALFTLAVPMVTTFGQNRAQLELFGVPDTQSSRNDLTDGIQSLEDWQKRRALLKKRYLKLLRDHYKPEKPVLDLKVHETVEVAGVYKRQLISYQVESDERAYAYLGIPLNLTGKAPAIVALHGTYEKGKESSRSG